MFKGRKVIAVCIPKAFNSDSFRYIKKLNEYACEKDYKLFVYQTCTDLYMNDSNDSGEKYVFDLIDYDAVDGVIIFTEMLKDKALSRRIADKAIAKGKPVVSVDAPMDGCINICYDYGDCFEKIVRHIIVDHKLTKVNFIAGFEGNDFSEERLNAYKRVLEEQGIPYDPERVGYGNFWEIPARQVMEKFLADGKELPEAIICSNDVMAMTACKCLQEKGYSVPDDVIVSGFDGIEDERYHSPRLTTCRSSEAEMSKSTIELIDKAINGEKVPENTVISFEMVISQSCGCVQKNAEDASDMINDLHSRLVGYMQRSYAMTGLMTTISSIKVPELMVEHFTNKDELSDTYCCLNSDALNPKSGVMDSISDKPFTDEMIMVYHGVYGKKTTEIIRFNRTDIAPGIERNYFEWNVPVVFSVLHYLDIPLGYLCMIIPLEPIYYERIQQIAEAYGNGFGNVRMYKAMERLYTHDPLTELYNRRGFYQLISSKFEKAEKTENAEIVIISADLDGLKPINDTYGHSEGDNAIKVVAQALESASVSGEICARFGGDEFVVAGITVDGKDYAESFKKRFYEFIDNYNKTSGKPYKVAASIGITCKKPDNLQIDDMIKMSDDLMYADKATRRIVRSRPREND